MGIERKMRKLDWKEKTNDDQTIRINLEAHKKPCEK